MSLISTNLPSTYIAKIISQPILKSSAVVEKPTVQSLKTQWENFKKNNLDQGADVSKQQRRLLTRNIVQQLAVLHAGGQLSKEMGTLAVQNLVAVSHMSTMSLHSKDSYNSTQQGIKTKFEDFGAKLQSVYVDLFANEYLYFLPELDSGPDSDQKNVSPSDSDDLDDEEMEKLHQLIEDILNPGIEI